MKVARFARIVKSPDFCGGWRHHWQPPTSQHHLSFLGRRWLPYHLLFLMMATRGDNIPIPLKP